MTLTQEELQLYKQQIEDTFLEVEFKFTKLNNVAYIGDMNEGNELLVYNYLFQELNEYPFTNNTYKSLLSNKDILRIVHRTNQIRNGNIK